MQLIPQGYIAQYNMEDLYQLVRENLKKHGKELSKPEPVSKVVNGKTVWLFEAKDLAGAAGPTALKKKYNKKPKLDEAGEVLAGPVHPL
jgi:hypothetical protein